MSLIPSIYLASQALLCETVLLAVHQHDTVIVVHLFLRVHVPIVGFIISLLLRNDWRFLINGGDDLLEDNEEQKSRQYPQTSRCRRLTVLSCK